MRLLSVALTSMSMDRWQGSIGRPCGRDIRGGAGGVSGGNHRQVRIYSSYRPEDSTRCGNIGGIVFFSKRNRYNRDFDHDNLASAVLGGISSPQKKLLKLETAQVKDIRAFLNSVEETEDLRNCFLRDLIPSFVRQRICMKSGYAGSSVYISDEDLLDCVHICVFPERELDGIAAEESLCSAARSVARATDAADMARFVGSLFDAMCKFVAAAGSTDFFMIDSDANR